MSEYIIESGVVGSVTVEVVPDPDPRNPREDGKDAGYESQMLCLHGRYELGDDHDFSSPQEIEEWWTENGKGGVRLPLYLYDHSGITMSTKPFSCPWDSGQVGFICITEEGIKTLGWDGLSVEKIGEYLTGEVEEYDSYIKGDVCGFRVKDADGDELDSCWGFYDPKDCYREGMAVAEHHSREINEESAAQWVEETWGQRG